MRQTTTALTVAAAVLLPTSSATCSFTYIKSSVAMRRHQPKAIPPMSLTTSWRKKLSMVRAHEREGQPRATKTPTKVLILQHSNEVCRRSATAPLLFDDDESGNDISQHLSAKRRTWSGRKDNEKIRQLIEETEKYDGIGPALLWTGTGGQKTFDQSSTAKNRSYIVLDGTWKEARTMFRKMPFLQRLPRISFEGGQWKTQYSLRSDYSNWRERFSEACVSSDVEDVGSDLLCTAESVAALLDLNGDEEGGDMIRRRLELFQNEYMYGT